MSDPDVCIAYDVARCMAELERRIGALVDAGRVRVDEAALAECKRRIERSTEACSLTRADVSVSCIAKLVEAVGPGEPCILRDALCADGTASCASGTCETLPASGESCEDLCAAGLVCRERRCVASSGAGGTCEIDSHCPPDHRCVAGVCAASATPADGACTSSAECEAGAICAGGVCAVATGLGACATDADCASLAECRPVMGRLCRAPTPLGAPCGSAVECGPEAWCDESGVAVCSPREVVGGPCPYGDSQCASGSFCDARSVPAVCSAPSGEGAPCTVGGVPGADGCLPELSCVRGVCSAAPLEGEACADDGECGSALACRIEGLTGLARCAPLASAGEPCDVIGWHNGCDSGLYCDPSGGVGVCVARRGLDEPCVGAPHECGDDLVCLVEGDRTGAGTCRTIPEAGETCADVCATGLVCAEAVLGGGRCAPRICNAAPEADPW